MLSSLVVLAHQRRFFENLRQPSRGARHGQQHAVASPQPLM
jgi:hypothetical protein